MGRLTWKSYFLSLPSINQGLCIHIGNWERNLRKYKLFYCISDLVDRNISEIGSRSMKNFARNPEPKKCPSNYTQYKEPGKRVSKNIFQVVTSCRISDLDEDLDKPSKQNEEGRWNNMIIERLHPIWLHSRKKKKVVPARFQKTSTVFPLYNLINRARSTPVFSMTTKVGIMVRNDLIIPFEVHRKQYW